MQDENETKTKDKTQHVLDLAVRLRNEATVYNRTLNRATIVATAVANIGVGGATDVGTEFVSITPTITCWTPMYAPATLNRGTFAGDVNRSLLEQAVIWNANNPIARQKQLLRWPTAAPHFENHYYQQPVSEISKTSMWSTLPSATSQVSDLAVSFHRPFTGDVIRGLTAQSMQFLSLNMDKGNARKAWNPTAWLMNMHLYFLSRDAMRGLAREDLDAWEVATGPLTTTVNDRLMYCPLIDKVTYQSDALIAATSATDAVVLGEVPYRAAVVNPVWRGGVLEQPAVFDRLLHSVEVQRAGAGGAVISTYCLDGDLAQDRTLVFTTEPSATAAANPAVVDYCLMVIPPSFLEDTAIAADRPKRLAMWIISQQPCMATVIASVTETDAAGHEMEGLMYWNGGTVRSLLARDMLVVVPIDMFQNVLVPARRNLAPPCFGSRPVVACRPFGVAGVGVGNYLTGDLVPANAPILARGAATANISLSAFVASWLPDITRSEWKWMIKWVRSRYYCESCLVDAVERVESQLATLPPNLIVTGREQVDELRREGRYAFTCDNRAGNPTNFEGSVWGTRVGADLVIRSRASARKVLVPAFYAELTSPLAMGLYKIDEPDKTIKLPEVYYTNDMDHMSLITWNVLVKSIIYDAVFTDLGLSEMMTLRSKRSKFGRIARVGANAVDTQMRELQDQFKSFGDRLWTRFDNGAEKFGYQYKKFMSMAKNYVGYVGAVCPCEAYMLEPEGSLPPWVAETVGGNPVRAYIDWFVTRGPATAAAAAPWAGVGNDYPNGAFWLLEDNHDYSLLFGYLRGGANINTVSRDVLSASLSCKGVWSWYVHMLFGRAIPEWKGDLRGDDLPWKVPEELTPENTGNFPVRWLPIESSAATVNVDRSVECKSIAPYEFERNWRVMTQLAEVDNFELRVKYLDHTVYDRDVSIEERPSAISFSVFGFPQGFAALPNGYALAEANLYASRFPRYTDDLRWLYIYSSEAQTRALWIGMQQHVGRNILLSSIHKRLPPMVYTVRGRSTIVTNVDDIGELPVSEKKVEEQAESQGGREDQAKPVVKDVIADTGHRQDEKTVEGSEDATDAAA